MCGGPFLCNVVVDLLGSVGFGDVDTGFLGKYGTLADVCVPEVMAIDGFVAVNRFVLEWNLESNSQVTAVLWDVGDVAVVSSAFAALIYVLVVPYAEGKG